MRGDALDGIAESYPEPQRVIYAAQRRAGFWTRCNYYLESWSFSVQTVYRRRVLASVYKFRWPHGHMPLELPGVEFEAEYPTLDLLLSLSRLVTQDYLRGREVCGRVRCVDVLDDLVRRISRTHIDETDRLLEQLGGYLRQPGPYLVAETNEARVLQTEAGRGTSVLRSEGI